MGVGRSIRETLKSTGLSITDLADRLDIGRPALSNMLREQASLSVELALKLEAEFGLNARKLLIRQLDDDIERARARQK